MAGRASHGIDRPRGYKKKKGKFNGKGRNKIKKKEKGNEGNTNGEERTCRIDTQSIQKNNTLTTGEQQ